MIVIPAAGEGRRFREAGYTQPKHLIPLAGIRMVDRVAHNVRQLDPSGDLQIITRDQVGQTRGTAETIARSTERITQGEPLVVANCDQLITIPDPWQPDGADAVIFTFPSCLEAHSYVIADEDGLISEIREKEVVSSQAVSGVYWFRDSGTILLCCVWLCASQRDGELYLSGALQRMIELGYRLYAVEAPTAILGTPEDMARFEVAMALCS